MEISKLIQHYHDKYEYKVFLTKLEHELQNAFIMYLYDYSSELDNFSETFLSYLPFYVRNNDYFEVIDNTEDIDEQLKIRSKQMRKKSSVIPQRPIASDGIYGELFLDFYLRIVKARAAVITYVNKRSFKSNYETTGPDNVVYYLDEEQQINICICEAKFVAGASNAKNNLLTDILGEHGTSAKPAHISTEYLNDYFQFIVEKGNNIQEPDRTTFKNFFNHLNQQLDNGNDFISILISDNICVNFVFFAIFDSTKRCPQKLEDYYKEIYSACEQQIQEIGLTNYKIEIVFIPTENTTMTIKEAMEKQYEEH